MNLQDILDKQEIVNKVTQLAKYTGRRIKNICSIPSYWYQDHVAWRIRYYLYHESCRNCRAWTYEGRRIRHGCPVMFGVCEWDKLSTKPIEWTAEFEYCNNYNELPFVDRKYTKLGDGWIANSQTPSGKKIVVISKNGRWLYLRDGTEE